MRKFLFAPIVDAMLNRIGAFFSNVVLTRLSTHVAASDAADIAAIEERIEALQEQGRPLAAKRLEAHLADYLADDPTYAPSISFGRRLLDDNFEIDTRHSLDDADGQNVKPRRARPRRSSANRIAQRPK